MSDSYSPGQLVRHTGTGETGTVVRPLDQNNTVVDWGDDGEPGATPNMHITAALN